MPEKSSAPVDRIQMCAWQGDVLQGGNRLIMKVPYAGDNGYPIGGIVCAE